MDNILLGSIVVLALADSLNPFTIAAQAYLLGTPKPMARSIVFLGATFVTYLLGGIVLLAGMDRILAQILAVIPAWGFGAGEIALALVLGFFAIYAGKMAKSGKPFSPPANLGIKATLVFAIASTASDLPTALPYFAAMSSIAAQDREVSHDLFLLGIYNLLYCAPMIALVIARVTLSEKNSDKLFGKLRAAIDWAFAKLLPLLAGAGAVALLIDGARRLVTL